MNLDLQYANATEPFLWTGSPCRFIWLEVWELQRPEKLKSCHHIVGCPANSVCVVTCLLVFLQLPILLIRWLRTS